MILNREIIRTEIEGSGGYYFVVLRQLSSGFKYEVVLYSPSNEKLLSDYASTRVGSKSLGKKLYRKTLRFFRDEHKEDGSK